MRAVAHAYDPAPVVNGFLLLALLALIAIGVVVAYRAGLARAQRESRDRPAPIEKLESATRETSQSVEQWRAAELTEDRHRLFRGLADARAETARYRQILVDLENNAPPPLLDGPGSPDDLKLIVGIGPVLERMLQQLGVNSYRQIARWTDRDIDEFDGRLHEFPGRIRRDAWVTQARALHHAKYGETLPVRERG